MLFLRFLRHSVRLPFAAVALAVAGAIVPDMAFAVPPAPTGLIAISGDQSVTLRWDPVPGATSYTVRRRSDVATGSYSTVKSGLTSTTYTQTHTVGGTGVQIVANGARYFYIVTATDATGTSDNSNQARGLPTAPLLPGTEVRWPVSGSAGVDGDVVRYLFGPRNIGRYDFHAGLDVNGAHGTPVYAAMAGTVTRKIAWDGVTTGSGNNLLVNHGQQRWTAYLHLHDFAAGIEVGTAVSAGQLLGYMGRSGASTNHLHFTYMVGLPTESNNETYSRSPLELLPHTPATGLATAVFREDGSRTVDLTIPAQHNTVRWIILRGVGVVRVVDYYDIVAQGSTPRDTQQQYGVELNVAAPTIAYPGGGGTVRLWVKPDAAMPGGDFEPTRVTMLDFNGNPLVDRTAYESWKAARGLPFDAADESDADGDGLPLLVEYALGLDPAVASTAGAPQLTGVPAGDRLEFTYRRLRPELTYVVEASADLVTWSAAGVTQEFAVNGDMITAAVPLDAGGRKFLRLAVSR